MINLCHMMYQLMFCFGQCWTHFSSLPWLPAFSSCVFSTWDMGLDFCTRRSGRFLCKAVAVSRSFVGTKQGHCLSSFQRVVTSTSVVYRDGLRANDFGYFLSFCFAFSPIIHQLSWTIILGLWCMASREYVILHSRWLVIFGGHTWGCLRLQVCQI